MTNYRDGRPAHTRERVRNKGLKKTLIREIRTLVAEGRL